MSMFSRLEALAKSVRQATEEMEKAAKKAEVLEKPPVSEAQRRAMHAAAAGNSTLGIPKSVGKDFATADEGGKLPEKKVKKGEKDEGSPEHEAKEQRLAEEIKDEAQELKDMHGKVKKAAEPPKPKEPKTLDYSKMKAPKAPEAAAPTIHYGGMSNPVRTPGQTEEGFKVPKEKKKVLTNPEFRTHLANQRRAAGVMKAEQFGTISPEALTKSIRAQHSDEQITAMLKAAVDSGNLHRNVLLEWATFRTINPAVLVFASDEE